MQSNRIKGKIVEAGFSQQDLAEKLRMSRNSLSNKINGKSPFYLDEVKQLCDILGIQDDAEKAQIFLS